jgi:protein involved in polysaccharide export with SLBB domain
MNRSLLMLAGLSLALSGHVARGQATSPPPASTAIQVANTNRTFSGASSPNLRADWQKRLTLGPGDVLNFSLFEQPDTGRNDVAIGPDGRVSFLQAVDVLATGLTIDELRSRMDTELGKFYRSPRTIITPAQYRSKKYYMLGTIANSGVYPLDRPTTMIEAIARAGGLQTGVFEQNTVELADLSHSFVVRGGRRLNVDLEALFQQGDLSQNIALEPEDFVYFPSAAANAIVVVGAVAGPGSVSYTPNASVISAITSRGGFVERAYQSRVLVVRGSLTKPETYVVDTKAILAGEQLDFKLEPKDIVFVSRRPWARAEEILDSATTAFIQSAVVTATGNYVFPNFNPFPNSP